MATAQTYMERNGPELIVRFTTEDGCSIELIYRRALSYPTIATQVRLRASSVLPGDQCVKKYLCVRPALKLDAVATAYATTEPGHETFNFSDDILEHTRSLDYVTCWLFQIQGSIPLGTSIDKAAIQIKPESGSFDDRFYAIALSSLPSSLSSITTPVESDYKTEITGNRTLDLNVTRLIQDLLVDATDEITEIIIAVFLKPNGSATGSVSCHSMTGEQEPFCYLLPRPEQ